MALKMFSTGYQEPKRKVRSIWLYYCLNGSLNIDLDYFEIKFDRDN